MDANASAAGTPTRFPSWLITAIWIEIRRPAMIDSPTAAPLT